MNSRLIFAGVLLAIGCGLASSGCRRPTPEERAFDQLSDYAELGLTSKSQDADIQNELARIKAENGWPLQLQEVEDLVEPGLDLSALFFDCFDSDWQLQSIHSGLMEIWPDGPLDFGDQLSQARSLVQRHQERREIMRSGLRQNGSRFRLDFTQGVAADTRWLTAAEVLARMEAIEVDYSVSSQKPNSAIDPLASIFRLAYKLGESPQLVTRLLAVDVRRIGLQGVQRVATSPHASEQTRGMLLELIEEQLAHWPAESQAWLGDRAVGLHVYEMVRGGEYLSLLTPQEIQALEAKRETVDRVYVVQMNVDEDERYYLKTMRKVLHLSDEPFYQRREVWDEQFSQLEEWRGGHGFPRVAADLMFPAFTTAQERIARDRARCETWRMALQKSLGQATDRNVIHGVTGEPLHFGEQEVGIVRVMGLEAQDEDLEPKLLPPAKP